MKAAVLGIKSGKTGAVALIGPSILAVWDFLDVQESVKILSSLNKLFRIELAVFEKIRFRPGDEPKHIEALVRNTEMWHTLLHVNDIPHEEHVAAVWKAGLLNDREPDDTSGYVKRAKSLFSKYPEKLFSRHDRAEAALMALCAWEHVRAGRAVRTA